MTDKKMKDICDECKFIGKPYDPVLPDFKSRSVKIMFIGENPSWELGLKEPLDPKSNSGKALDENYLKPLGLTRNDVWITNLIKCRYPLEPIDIYHNKAGYQKEIQETADICSKLWLHEELSYAKPKIIVTLSDKEVYQRFRKIFDPKLPANFKEKAVGKEHDVIINGISYILFPMVHPDISRPLDDPDKRKLKVREVWSPLHFNTHIPALKVLLA